MFHDFIKQKLLTNHYLYIFKQQIVKTNWFPISYGLNKASGSLLDQQLGHY